MCNVQHAYMKMVEAGAPRWTSVQVHSLAQALPKTNWANVLDKPPYEAYAITCGITFTFGGLRTNDDGSVLDTELNPIPGLYAAGELIGGMFCFNYPGGTGLMSGAIFGRMAGNSAGALAKGN